MTVFCGLQLEFLCAIGTRRPHAGCQMGIFVHDAVGHPAVTLNILVVIANDFPARLDHEAGRNAVSSEQIRRDFLAIGYIAWFRTLSSEFAHFTATNRDEVVWSLGIRCLHNVVSLVIVYLSKRKNVHRILPWRHRQDIAAMVAIIEIIIWMRHGLLRAFHAGRVTPRDEVRCARIASGFRMEEHFCGTRVDHRSRPDGHDRGVCVQHAVLDDRLVLLHTHI
mmetsp:Transcript_1482/g.2436  ORF Transcript_1482/g.2436 Transcript_1482/m.2436 type:complete len:222 (-) Transcript_1482:1956-2621(-)